MNSFEIITERISRVANALAGLNQDVVYVGGSAVGFYIENPSIRELRPTEDIDCVVQVYSRTQYYALEKQLRGIGFKQSLSIPAPICRWIYDSIVVDIMPSDEKILGFSNKWFAKGFSEKKPFQLPGKDAPIIYILPLVFFIATKFEAFFDRGKNDYLGSPDLEDIVTVLDGIRDINLLTNGDSQVSGFVRAYIADSSVFGCG